MTKVRINGTIEGPKNGQKGLLKMTYLHALVAECDAISDEDVAGQLASLPPSKESETVLGRASIELLRLYALFSQTIDAANVMAERFNTARSADEPNIEVLEKLHEEHTILDKKMKTLKFAFWQSVYAEYPLPEDSSGHALRADGDIVAMPKRGEGGMHIIAIDMSSLFGRDDSDDNRSFSLLDILRGRGGRRRRPH